MNKLELFGFNTVLTSYLVDLHTANEMEKMGQLEIAQGYRRNHVLLCQQFLDAIDQEEKTYETSEGLYKVTKKGLIEIKK